VEADSILPDPLAGGESPLPTIPPPLSALRASSFFLFFIFKHSWASKRPWKISHGSPGKSWKSPGFVVSKIMGTPTAIFLLYLSVT